MEQSAITCFRAARVSTILIDDGIELDKMVDIEWHKKVVPMVGRILRIEHLAEKILDKVMYKSFRSIYYCIEFNFCTSTAIRSL